MQPYAKPNNIMDICGIACERAFRIDTDNNRFIAKGGVHRLIERNVWEALVSNPGYVPSTG